MPGMTSAGIPSCSLASITGATFSTFASPSKARKSTERALRAHPARRAAFEVVAGAVAVSDCIDRPSASAVGPSGPPTRAAPREAGPDEAPASRRGAIRDVSTGWTRGRASPTAPTSLEYGPWTLFHDSTAVLRNPGLDQLPHE